ncbi:MAG: hypothetical protein H6819_03620 [Phycisphaerales bacterium]|nr:hypothetical protein [Phycisphaerales bacterium]MCB9856286.1 hypothetical protein [Phycisphaerales bacterium]MCB9863275.1 hypothetical protein [Phycisphaerales bacterium]
MQQTQWKAMRRRVFFVTWAIASGFVPALTATALASDPAPDVEIKSDIVGRSICWHIHNAGDAAIVRIRIPAMGACDHEVPDGWEFENTDGSMHAWATDGKAGIRKGLSRDFRITGGAAGLQPGLTTAELTLTGDRVVRVESVLTFRGERLWTTALPPVTIAGMAIILLWRRRSRAARRQPS